MTPQELKNSILQQAIQGRLVEQRPEEGTAEELYQQIQAEKQRLIKAKKIKKDKPLPEITEEEKPFDIPESWKWVRLAGITTLNPKNDLDDSCETSFIPMACVSDGYRNEHTTEIRRWGDIKKGFTHFADGDIGIAKITPCFQNRKSVIFQNLTNGFGAGTTELSIVRVIGDSLDRKYLLWFFKTHHFIFNGVKSFTGTAGQQRIHKDYLPQCLIPLPPLAEQKRIVAKIEQLLPLIDRYEAAWTKLEAFNKRFPEEMQKSILQQAIQGKLVEQRPEEGTGEELYQQIQAEKRALIKAKKIKKDKPLPEITDDEKPFEIPESWKWVRLGNLFFIERGSSPRPIQSYLTTAEDGVNWIKIGDSEAGAKYITSTNSKITIEGAAKSRLVKVGDFIISNSMSYGRPYIMAIEGYVHDGWNIIHNIQLGNGTVFNTEYLYYVLSSSLLKEQMKTKAAGGVVKNIKSEYLRELIIPIPPLAEQKRIVSKIEQLLPLCERLK